MDEIFFTSRINWEFKDQIESLLFFNPEQYNVIDGIIASIDKYGLPQITEENGFVKIIVGELENVQNIYLCRNILNKLEILGISLYYRLSLEQISILHIAINKNYSLRSQNSSQFMFLKLINEIRNVAKNLKGIQKLQIFYNKNQSFFISI